MQNDHRDIYAQGIYAADHHLNGEERAGCFALLSSSCLVTVSVLWLFLVVPWVSMRCVIVVFPDHNHLFFVGFFLK